MSTPLPPETIAAVITRLAAGDRPTAVAADLNLSYFTVNWWRRRLRDDIPWAEALEPFECDVCGQPGLGARGRRAHPGCERERTAQRARTRRARRAPGSLSTPYVDDWRRAHPHADARDAIAERARARARMSEAGPDARAAAADRAHEYDRASADRTAALAGRSGEPYTGDDDLVILERARDSAESIALDLGRTTWSVRSRRSLLLRRHPELAGLVRAAVATTHGHWLWPDAATEHSTANRLWELTYPGRALPRSTCPRRGCIRPSHHTQ